MLFLKENWFLISVFLTLVLVLIKGGAWIGSTNTSIDFLKKGLADVKKSLEVVQDDIKKILGRLPEQKTTQSSSPIKLTDLGKDVSKHVDADIWVANNFSEVFDKAKGKEEFEIFEICKEHVNRSFAEREEFARIVKSAAYNFGIEEEQVLAVYQIELRDYVIGRLNNAQQPHHHLQASQEKPEET